MVPGPWSLVEINNPHPNYPMKLSENFTLEEFVRNDHGVANEPPVDVLPVLRQFCEEVLEPLRAWCGGPVVITSGYRCPELNRLVGGTADSYHQAMAFRCAADVRAPRRTLQEVFEWLCNDSHLMFDSVILERGSNPAAETDDCVHIQFRVHYPRRIAFVGMTHNRGVYRPVEVAA